MMNTFTERPGKVFQTFGTGFQLTPLVLIMFLVIFLFIAPSLFAPVGEEILTTPGDWGPYLPPSNGVYQPIYDPALVGGSNTFD